jgi:putative PIN family toxin of toxin-antitoxin system
MVISEHILVEVERTLTKPYFSRYLTTADQAHAIESLRIDATVVEITAVVQGVATHPEDDLILATAVSGQVDYLVTNDRQLLRLGEYQGVRIVTSGEFLSILDAESNG